MDFYDFIAQCNDKYGTVDEDWVNLKETAIITFDYDDFGHISGKYNRKPVFRNNNYEDTILAGETWICTLELNPKSGSNYFAKPVQKIDASFMFELKKDQIDEIASSLWNSRRSSLEPLLEEKYHEETEKKLTKAIDDAKAAYESKMAELNATIADLEHKNNENKQIISSLEERAKTKPAVTGNVSGGINAMCDIGFCPNATVRRVGPDTISSEYFTKNRYFVHISADCRIMIIHPHEDGNVVCIENTIILDGLSSVSSFSEPYDMVSEYNPNYGGVQIYLR